MTRRIAIMALPERRPHLLAALAQESGTDAVQLHRGGAQA
jgi:hypothetical protein